MEPALRLRFGPPALLTPGLCLVISPLKALPGLIWNTMMSVSGGWFFVVFSEAIPVNNGSIALPGVGSYIALASEQRNLKAIGWAILTMLIVILIYDQLLKSLVQRSTLCIGFSGACGIEHFVDFRILVVPELGVPRAAGMIERID